MPPTSPSASAPSPRVGGTPSSGPRILCTFHGAIYTCNHGDASGWKPLAKGYVPLHIVLDEKKELAPFKLVSTGPSGKILDYDIGINTRARRTKATFMQWHVKGDKLNHGVQLVNEDEAAKFESMIAEAIDMAKEGQEKAIRNRDMRHRLNHLNRTGQVTEAYQLLKDKSGGRQFVIKINLPDNQSTTLAVTPVATLAELLHLVCEKRKLDPSTLAFQNDRTGALFSVADLSTIQIGDLDKNEITAKSLSQAISQNKSKAEQLSLLASHAQSRTATGVAAGQVSDEKFVTVHLPDGSQTTIKVPLSMSMGEMLFYIAEKRNLDPGLVFMAENASGKRPLSMKGTIGQSRVSEIYMVHKQAKSPGQRRAGLGGTLRRGQAADQLARHFAATDGAGDQSSLSPFERSKTLGADPSPRPRIGGPTLSAATLDRDAAEAARLNKEVQMVTSLLAEGVPIDSPRMPRPWRDIFVAGGVERAVVHDAGQRHYILETVREHGGPTKMLREQSKEMLHTLLDRAVNFRSAKTTSKKNSMEIEYSPTTIRRRRGTMDMPVSMVASRKARESLDATARGSGGTSPLNGGHSPTADQPDGDNNGDSPGGHRSSRPSVLRSLIADSEAPKPRRKAPPPPPNQAPTNTRLSINAGTTSPGPRRRTGSNASMGSTGATGGSISLSPGPMRRRTGSNASIGSSTSGASTGAPAGSPVKPPRPPQPTSASPVRSGPPSRQSSAGSGRFDTDSAALPASNRPARPPQPSAEALARGHDQPHRPSPVGPGGATASSPARRGPKPLVLDGSNAPSAASLRPDGGVDGRRGSSPIRARTPPPSRPPPSPSRASATAVAVDGQIPAGDTFLPPWKRRNSFNRSQEDVSGSQNGGSQPSSPRRRPRSPGTRSLTRHGSNSSLNSTNSISSVGSANSIRSAGMVCPPPADDSDSYRHRPASLQNSASSQQLSHEMRRQRSSSSLDSSLTHSAPNSPRRSAGGGSSTDVGRRSPGPTGRRSPGPRRASDRFPVPPPPVPPPIAAKESASVTHADALKTPLASQQHQPHSAAETGLLTPKASAGASSGVDESDDSAFGFGFGDSPMASPMTSPKLQRKAPPPAVAPKPSGSRSSLTGDAAAPPPPAPVDKDMTVQLPPAPPPPESTTDDLLTLPPPPPPPATASTQSSTSSLVVPPPPPPEDDASVGEHAAEPSVAAKCGGCAAPLGEGVKFCAECGVPVGVSLPPPPAVLSLPPPLPDIDDTFALPPPEDFAFDLPPPPLELVADLDELPPPPPPAEPEVVEAAPPSPPPPPPPPAESLLPASLLREASKASLSGIPPAKRPSLLDDVRRASVDNLKHAEPIEKAVDPRDKLLSSLKGSGSRDHLRHVDEADINKNRPEDPRDSLLLAIRQSSTDLLRPTGGPKKPELDARDSLLASIRDAKLSSLKKVAPQEKGIELDARSALLVSLGALGRGKQTLKKVKVEARPTGTLKRMNSMQAAISKVLDGRRGAMEDDNGVEDEDWD